MSKYACRKALTETLLELAQNNPKIVAITSDARGSVTLNEYAKKCPDQFVETGIAEQNEVGVASGMATCGMIPFVCAPAPFLSARALEQIKVDVAYSHTNVKICGVSGGLSYGALGGSHHAINDIAAIRPMAGMMVLLPSDATQTRWMVRELANYKGPSYMRMGRNAVEDIYDQNDIGKFKLGKAITLREGTDVTIIAAGEMVFYAKLAADLLEKKNIDARVLDMHTIKPLDREAVIAAAKETGHLVTVEEHSIFGGLGGSVAEVVVSECPVPIKILGIPDEHVISGESTEVFAYYKIDAAGIAAAAESLLRE